jgi:hypothetical protein
VIGLVTLLLGVGVAQADEDIGALLDSIPEIVAPEPEVVEGEAKPLPPPEEQESFPAYSERVRAAVLAAWSPKKKVIDKDRRASIQLMIKVSEAGEVVDVVAIELSGNKKFDASVLDAIQAADVPEPPSTLVSQTERGMMLTIRAADSR